MRIAIFLCFHLVSQAFALGEDDKRDTIVKVDGEDEDIRRASYKQLHRDLFSNRRRSRFGVKLLGKEVQNKSKQEPVTLIEASQEDTAENPLVVIEKASENITNKSKIFFRNRFRFRPTTEKTNSVEKLIAPKQSNIIKITKKPKKKFSRKNLFPKLQLGPSTITKSKDESSSGEQNNETTLTKQPIEKVSFFRSKGRFRKHYKQRK